MVIYLAPPPVDEAPDRRRLFFFLVTTETEIDGARHHADCCWHRERIPVYDLGRSGVHSLRGRIKVHTHTHTEDTHKCGPDNVFTMHVALLELCMIQY